MRTWGARVRGERGASSLEYIGALMMSVVAAGAVYLAVGNSQVTVPTKNAVCEVLSFGGCSTGGGDQGGDNGDGNGEDDGGSDQEQVDIPPGLDPDSEIVQILLSTERGRATLQWLFDNNIPIVVDPGATGAFWDGSKVVLGEGYDNAAVLVHETNHAHYTVEDRNPDIDDDSRDDYVGSLIAQETDGTVQQILADREFDDAGHDLGTQPGETEYWAAHDQAIADGKSETEAGQAGYDAVHDLFTSGGFVTSTTGESYPDYYGGAWDDAH